MRETDVNKNNTNGDMTAWLGMFIGICQENVSLNEKRSGIIMFQKVCLKMKIQTLVGLKCLKRYGNEARRLYLVNIKRKAVKV